MVSSAKNFFANLSQIGSHINYGQTNTRSFVLIISRRGKVYRLLAAAEEFPYIHLIKNAAARGFSPRKKLRGEGKIVNETHAIHSL